MNEQAAVKRFGLTEEDVRISQCALCVHKRESVTCGAFPFKIPDAILSNQVDHRGAIASDNGIQFVPVDNAASGKMSQMFDTVTATEG